jgi:hypothetical protein
LTIAILRGGALVLFAALVACGPAASSVSPTASDLGSVASSIPNDVGTVAPTAPTPSRSMPSAKASFDLADPCSYLTIEEAGQALGSPIDTATALPDAPGCVYEIDGSKTAIGVEFTDEAYWTDARTGRYQYLNIDLGDDAYFFGDGQVLVFVVREGSTYFSVVVVGVGLGSPHTALAAGRSAVEFVLSRLP